MALLELDRGAVRMGMVSCIVCALAGLILLVEATDEDALLRSHRLRVRPNEMWRGNDCSSQLPEHIELRCRRNSFIELTTSFYGRKKCNNVEFSCVCNFTMAMELCDGEHTCTINRETLRAEKCGLLSQENQFVHLQYQCEKMDTSQNQVESNLLAILIGVLVGVLLLVLIVVLVILWRRTKKLTTVAKIQTLELQKMGKNSKPKTSFANLEYDLDSVILPTFPLPRGKKDNSLEYHEYADVDELKMDKGSMPFERSKCPTPPGDCESKRYLTLIDSTSVPTDTYSDYANSTDEQKARIPKEDYEDEPRLPKKDYEDKPCLPTEDYKEKIWLPKEDQDKAGYFLASEVKSNFV